MNLLHRLFPSLFPSSPEPSVPEGVAELHRALKELEPSTEALKRRLERDEPIRPDLATTLREARRQHEVPS